MWQPGKQHSRGRTPAVGFTTFPPSLSGGVPGSLSVSFSGDIDRPPFLFFSNDFLEAILEKKERDTSHKTNICTYLGSMLSVPTALDSMLDMKNDVSIIFVMMLYQKPSNSRKICSQSLVQIQILVSHLRVKKLEGGDVCGAREE